MEKKTAEENKMIPGALVLEGGSMRCLFTAGVLDVFLEKNMNFEYVIGVSAGSMTGMSYISRQPGRNEGRDPGLCKGLQIPELSPPGAGSVRFLISIFSLERLAMNWCPLTGRPLNNRPSALWRWLPDVKQVSRSTLRRESAPILKPRWQHPAACPSFPG